MIVMDCALPGTSGLAATRKILETAPPKAILMLSMHSEDTLVRQALDAGARGYILKNAVDLELATAIRKVAAGEIVLDPQLAKTGQSLRGERNAGLTAPRTRNPSAHSGWQVQQGNCRRSRSSALTLLRFTAPISWTLWASTKQPNSSSMPSATGSLTFREKLLLMVLQYCS